MKSARSIGKARNARLNQTRRAMGELKSLLDQEAGVAHSDLILDPDFWNEGRVLVAQIAQCFNEANAHNNDLVDEAIAFDDENVELKRPAAEGGATGI